MPPDDDLESGSSSPGADPNTARELAKARNDAKSYREEAKRLREDAETVRNEANGLRGKLKQTQDEAVATLAKSLDDLRNDLSGKVSEAETKAAAATESARLRSIRADLRVAARDAGMSKLDLYLKLIDMADVHVDANGDVTNAADLMAAMKKANPEMFGKDSSSNPTPAPKPADGTVKKAGDMTPAERAAEEKRLGISR